MLVEREGRALYIYPINALVNDQLKSLFKINLALGREALGVARYTGSLSAEKRRDTRARQPNIFLTNPEMVHLSFLLWHQNWQDLWRNLRFIVIDEVHTYRGVFGSNMAQLLRRVLRMAEHYGAIPQFVCCSATIANPKELVQNLIGREFHVVDHDGAGRGQRYFVLWNPPLTSADGSNVRRSYVEESVDLLLHCIRASYNTILFARARRLTERMLRLTKATNQTLVETNHGQAISSYRAGYLSEEREEIESRLKTGDIRGIITTNALEMGIDIGGLDAAIIAGYPGTIMSTWQQAGRAGRRGRDALIFLVASQNPLDQYYMGHPQEFFARPHELAVVDLQNPYIRLKHLLCGARELPLTADELSRMEPDLQDTVYELRDRQLLEPCKLADNSEGLTCPQGRRDIHFRVALRSASHETFHILDQDRNEIGTIEPPNAYREAHPGAIYQHGEDDYRVVSLRKRDNTILVRPEAAPHYTRSLSMLGVHIEGIHASRFLTPAESGVGTPFGVVHGDVLVEEKVYGYEELQWGTEEMVKRVNLDYPLIMRLHTTAMWLTLPPGLEQWLSVRIGLQVTDDADATEPLDGEALLARGLHGVEHLLTGVLPLLVMCDRRDVDGYHLLRLPGLDAPAVFVYDSYEGGIGLAEVAYQRVTELLQLAYSTVASCPCNAGCPSCIQSGACRQRNDMLHKGAAQAILALLAESGSMPSGAGPLLDSPINSLAAHGQSMARPDMSRKRALQDLLERTREQGIRQRISASEKAESSVPGESRFVRGDQVEYSLYGRGTVLSPRLDGDRQIVIVRFAHRNLVKEIDGSRCTLLKRGDDADKIEQMY